LLLRGLLRGLLSLASLLPAALLPATLPLTLAVPEPGGLPNLRALHLYFRQGFPGRFSAGRAGGRLDFAADLGVFRGNLLA
jgi:hypothetical protein